MTSPEVKVGWMILGDNVIHLMTIESNGFCSLIIPLFTLQKSDRCSIVRPNEIFRQFSISANKISKITQ